MQHLHFNYPFPCHVSLSQSSFLAICHLADLTSAVSQGVDAARSRFCFPNLGVPIIQALRSERGCLHSVPSMSLVQQGLDKGPEHASKDIVRSLSSLELEGRNVTACCCSSDQPKHEQVGRKSTSLSLASKHMETLCDAYTEEIRHLHSLLDTQEDARERSARQTAAGRALWNHVIHDPFADIMAGESHLRKFQVKMEKAREIKAREAAGVMLAVRTLWFDSKLEAALNCSAADSTKKFEGNTQVVLLGAGMDTRAYRLKCLEGCIVYEVDLSKVLDFKSALLKSVADDGRPIPNLWARHVERVAADLSSDDWFDKLREAGYNPRQHTVWVLEGILYYLRDQEAKAVLSRISQNCQSETVVLADFMNECSTHLACELQTDFYFHSDWPEELLPSLGFSQVQVSQIGDTDANFGLIEDPQSFFNKLRKIPRYTKSDVDGTPCRRLYLVQSSVP